MTENRTFWKAEEQKLEDRRQEAICTGGQTALDTLAKRDKRPVRQLIADLIDPDTPFFELSVLAGFGMGYPGVEDVPCAGIVTGIGKIHGNWTMIMANDSRVKAGSYFPITLKKHMRAQAIAEKNGLNCVYIADSGGVFLPLQADVFPDDQHFGSIFYNMARMSARGLRQITISTGGNTAGGAYIVFMACESIMIDRQSFSFLGGPPLVKMATGEEISAENLGGAKVHTQISGGADHLCADQAQAIGRARALLSLTRPQKRHLHTYESKAPLVPPGTLYDVLPISPYTGINGKKILEAIADESEFIEHKKDFAPGRGSNILVGRIRIKGLPIGVVCSNAAGIIFHESAKKVTEWVVRCSHEKIPLLFIQSSPGYMIGSDSEHAGIGKYGADMVRAVSCAQVPRVQLVIGPDNGAANYGMCGRGYRPNFLFSTMRAKTGVMSGKSAGGVLLSIEQAKQSALGTPMTPDEVENFQQKMIDKYDGEAHPFFCASRILNDRLLKFSEIRDWLAMAFEVSLINPIGEASFGNFRF
ncbi:carboxyl transferase domain-containing protein [Desulfobacula sp.]|uniref:acyl-CoA carboxylase subunit beta n=1 Tax=Desulfobacula sp. TaxID=2593537 RepID=UPI00262E8606|nr:carboxyl transferase domain-containing protein [Desulfobacula sp.]